MDRVYRGYVGRTRKTQWLILSLLLARNICHAKHLICSLYLFSKYANSGQQWSRFCSIKLRPTSRCSEQWVGGESGVIQTLLSLQLKKSRINHDNKVLQIFYSPNAVAITLQMVTYQQVESCAQDQARIKKTMQLP